MSLHEWTVTSLTGTLGAALTGGRVANGVDGAWLAEQLTTHLVLVMPGQSPTHAQQVELARSLGEPTPAHPVVPGHPDHPEILVLDAAQGGRNARWHTDVTFMPTPPAASVLVSDAVPAYGGDTMWADMRTAYDRLAPALQIAIENLEAVHRISPLAYWGEPFDTAMERNDVQQLFDDASRMPAVTHPVVRVHPVTGRRSLFVNPGFTSHIVGLSRIESDGLLGLLYEHATQPEFLMRHHWGAGDIVIWDNRATMHYAVDDYGSVERRMRRVTVRGGTAVGPSGVESRIVTDPLVAVR